tara:strand:+ start:3807 stop:4445 length:639 start_codon:yes stop_codon:yes gene_type:complete
MPLLNSGKTFSNGEQLTADKLNSMFTSSTIDENALDSTLSLSSGGTKLAVNQVSSVNISDDAVQSKHISTDALTDILKFVYPVGSIFTTDSDLYNTASRVAARFGFGTWVAIGEGRVLVGKGTGDFSDVGNTGGEQSVILTTTQIPPHNHTFTRPATRTDSENDNNSAQSGAYETQTSGNGNVGENGDGTGNASAHNNMPPYQVVYMWKRLA